MTDKPICECGNTSFNRISNCAHGMMETHIAGTERLKCTNCGKDYFKYEGEKIGLKYLWD